MSAGLFGLCLLAVYGVGRQLVALGAPEAKPGYRSVVAAVATFLLAVLFLITEIGQAAGSDVHSGLGAIGVPFYWAGVFAPWLAIRHWGPKPAGQFSKSRVAILLLLLGGCFGWYANPRDWY